MTTYAPHSSVVDHSHVKSMDEYKKLYDQSINDPQGFWAEQAQRVSFFREPDNLMDVSMGDAEFAWFSGAKLNVCYNCVDRHVPEHGDETAIIWVGDEPGEYTHITYRQLYSEVCRMANVLKSHGVQHGDRVCLYMPMIPEVAYAMLACARLGAVHSVVFAGFSAESLRDRIVDADCRIVLTANEGLRGSKKIPLKKTVDAAVEGTNVSTVIVAKRTDVDVPMKEGRDYWLEEEMKNQRSRCPAEWVDAEDPLFILYTSGSTGKPKGMMHTSAGYLVYTATTHKYVFDYKPGDVYCCAADVGWITGHSYIIYGPLANRATTVMFESVPTYPDPGRYWQIVEDIGVNIFYTAPTALRAIARFGDEHVTKYNRDSLRILGTVGEPINPEIWEWYHRVVGNERCSIVDTYWQTETGGVVMTPLPGATPTKPGAATFPFFGIKPELMDEKGQVVSGNGVEGNLCLGQPWPGQARTIWGDHQRYHETYFSQYPGHYFTGDGCRRDEDGYYWITGRVDDVLNVSGHRLGTAEVESALVLHDAVAEAAVVGYPHEVKGQGIFAYVITNESASASDDVIKDLKGKVREVIGPIATPDVILVVGGLPKTRSGKIMRRILRKVAAGEYQDLGDITTLADPSVVESIVSAHKAL